MSANDTSRQYPDRPHVAVSLALFRADTVLLASRALTERGHLYSLPGGMVEPGETLEQAVLRELHEEVGLHAANPILIYPHEIIDKDAKDAIRHHVVLMVHAAWWQGGEAQTGPEALDIKWANFDEIEQLHTTPHLAEVVRRAKIVLDQSAKRT